MRNNVVKMYLPDHFKIHPVVHASHMTPSVGHLEALALSMRIDPAPIPAIHSDEHGLEKVLSQGIEDEDFSFTRL